jgi:hypothetical protein
MILDMFILERISPEPAGWFQSNFLQIIPCIKESHVCTNKGPSLLQRGDDCKNAKIRLVIKILFLNWTRKAQIYNNKKAFLYSGN